VRIVLDTNVLVSALLTEEGPSAQVLTLVLGGELSLLFDARILAEYAEVLARPRFEFDAKEVAETLQQLEGDGERVDSTPVEQKLPDPDDQPFLEVALAGKAAAIVTGNLRHFPSGLGVDVLSPRALLGRLEGE
jgi:putative PIN family toxin of toxin-antitoxin system